MENPNTGLVKTETTVREHHHHHHHHHGEEGDVTLATGIEMDVTPSGTGSQLKEEEHEKSESSFAGPLGQFIFSDTINRIRTIRVNRPHEMTQMAPANNRFMITSSTNTASFTKGHLPGHVPLTSLFHMESNRENKGPEDDALEDADLTAADGIIRARKDKSQKKMVLPSDSLKIVKGEFTFPHRTYKPKCQIAFRVPAGQIPQAVMAERLHRIYKKTDINLVLQTLGIELSDLIPPPNYGENNERFYHEMMFRNRTKINGFDKKDVLTHGGRFKTYGLNEEEEEAHIHRAESDSTVSTSSIGSSKLNEERRTSKSSKDDEDQDKNKEAVHPFIQSKSVFNAQFPLSYFDNSEFDIRSGEDWCRLGWDEKEKKFYPLPGKALLPFPLSSEKRERIKAPSEVTLDELLRKTPRLEKFRSWLLRQRYMRQVKLVGLDPTKLIRLAPSDMEMAIVARLGSTVETVTSLSEESIHEPKPKVVRKSILRKTNNDGEETHQGPGNVDSDEFESGDEEHNGSGSEHDVIKKQVVVEKDEEYLNIVFKLRQPKKDDDLSDEDDRALTTKDDAKRSVSILSDIFSDLDSLTLLGSELITNAHRGAGGEGEATDAEEIDEDSERAADAKARGLNRPARSYFLGDYGINIPSSPDFDPFEDGLDQYVMDFDKMKKVHIYDWRWVDVAVFDFHPVDNKYFVRSIHPPIVYAWVSKVYLVFDAEDPNRHGLRIKDAVKRRFEMENIMRYNLYIDCLPVTDFPTLEDKTFENIIKYVIKTSNIVITDYAMIKVRKEINLEFQRAIAEEKFEKLVDKHQKTFKPWVQIPDKQETSILTNLENINKPVRTLYEFLPSVHLQNFEYKVKSIQKNTIIYTNEAWKPYKEITSICLEAKEKTLIVTAGLEPMYLAQWEQTQLDNMEVLRLYLKNEWYEAVLDNVIINFEKLNKSWYNVAENNYDVFLMSKLFNFLQLVKLLMQDTIRSIIKDSCTGFMLQIKAFSVGIDATTDWSWGDDLTKSQYPSPPGLTPIWNLEMHMDPVDGPKYAQPLASYYKTAYTLLCHAIQSCSNDMPTFLTRIMPQMKFIPAGFLQGVDENEAVMIDLAHNLVKFTKLILVPLETYIRKYKRYKDVWTLDIPVYIKKLESTDPSAQDIKKLVDQNLRHMEKLEKEIPCEIEITAFRIIVEHVRSAILTKKRTLITSILNSYAEKLRKIIQRVIKEYTEMEKKLTLRSDDIEEVMELKGYAEIVPSLVARLDIVTNAVKKDYEVFDHFLYQVTEADENAKWKAALSSNRMLRLGREAIRLLDEDYDRLLKVQQAELSSLSDQVDSATLSVAGLVAFTDIETTKDVCQELNKIMDTIHNLQVQSALLNRRQRVFNLPMAQNEALHRLTRDIEPFKHLWFTASEWLDVQNTLYNGSLHNVDINQVMKVIHEGGKVIGRCIRYFVGANQIQHSAKLIKHQLEEFKPLVPLVGVLKMSEMRLRHWEAITDLCGFPVDETGHQNFKHLLDLGIREHVPKITDIGALASKEFEIEHALDTMRNGIAEHRIIISFNSELKVRTMIINKETLHVINDYIGITNILLENPYNPPFEEELGTWNRKIKLCKVNLELWIDNQDKWLHIQPTFQAPDAATKFKVTFKVFERMQRIWRRLTRLARDNPSLLDLASDNTTSATLQQFARLLVNIQQALEELMRPKGSDESDDD